MLYLNKQRGSCHGGNCHGRNYPGFVGIIYHNKNPVFYQINHYKYVLRPHKIDKYSSITRSARKFVQLVKWLSQEWSFWFKIIPCKYDRASCKIMYDMRLKMFNNSANAHTLESRMSSKSRAKLLALSRFMRIIISCYRWVLVRIQCFSNINCSR